MIVANTQWLLFYMSLVHMLEGRMLGVIYLTCSLTSSFILLLQVYLKLLIDIFTVGNKISFEQSERSSIHDVSWS